MVEMSSSFHIRQYFHSAVNIVSRFSQYFEHIHKSQASIIADIIRSVIKTQFFLILAIDNTFYKDNCGNR